MRLFIHSTAGLEPEVVEVEETVVVRTLVTVEDGPNAETIWVEEAAEPLDLEITLAAAGLKHGDHVHRHRCKKIDAHIRYGGGTKTDKVRPATTTRALLGWATGDHGFDLSKEEAAKHHLVLPNTDGKPIPGDAHVGSLTSDGSCQVTLDLVPKVRHEG